MWWRGVLGLVACFSLGWLPAAEVGVEPGQGQADNLPAVSIGIDPANPAIELASPTGVSDTPLAANAGVESGAGENTPRVIESKFLATPGENKAAPSVRTVTVEETSTTGAFFIRPQLGRGEEKSWVFSLYLGKNFCPLFSGTGWSLSPLVEAGAFVWDRSNESLNGAGLGGGLTFSWGGYGWRPFIEGTFGPTLVSKNSFGGKHLGRALQFRSRLAVGVAFGKIGRHRLEVEAAHYDESFISHADRGFSTIGLGYGFSF
ncbi:MAG: acyloxyacyl hydrolase [Planctomycetota bacterium]|jgi:hypothetical protein|nr:acyloxyacyl hydrolase [Planctomycetota bacterium]